MITAELEHINLLLEKDDWVEVFVHARASGERVIYIKVNGTDRVLLNGSYNRVRVERNNDRSHV